jgi:peptidoglycan/xylan/chitin deacetylase (PgdA/CDA1 family)
MQDAAQAAPAPRATDVMSSRHLRGAALGAATVTAAHAAPALCAVAAPARRLLGVRDRIDDRSAVALTFDDGPHPRGTPATLEILREANAVATFFLVGEQVRRRPALAREIVAAGHAVGVHADRHRNLLRLTPGQVRGDLMRAEATIADAIGTVAPVYRPPYGILSAAGVRHARSRRWEIVLWARWGRDWRARATPASIAAEAAAALRGGEIVLLHDSDAYAAPGSWATTVQALPRILERVEAAGLVTDRLGGCQVAFR